MKKKFELEYAINSSPNVLFNRLSTPGGLSEWFADDVNLHGDIFTFIWEETEQQAEVMLDPVEQTAQRLYSRLVTHCLTNRQQVPLDAAAFYHLHGQCSPEVTVGARD